MSNNMYIRLNYSLKLQTFSNYKGPTEVQKGKCVRSTNPKPFEMSQWDRRIFRLQLDHMRKMLEKTESQIKIRMNYI